MIRLEIVTQDIAFNLRGRHIGPLQGRPHFEKQMVVVVSDDMISCGFIRRDVLALDWSIHEPVLQRQRSLQLSGPGATLRNSLVLQGCRARLLKMGSRNLILARKENCRK